MFGALGPWPLRLGWLVAPLVIGAAIAEALDERSAAVAATAAVLCWLAWGAGLVATLVAHPWSLTTLRVSAPAMALVAVVAVMSARPPLLLAVTSVALALGVAALALSAATADRCVDGASYGSEQRFALRIPLPLLFGPVPLAWLAVLGGLSVGPLLLAAGQWLAGGAMTVIGAGAALVGLRALHGLSNRFVVLVPAGFVLHDTATLSDPVLFSRDAMASLGAAPLDTDATDLSLRAMGLVLQLRLRDPLQVPRRQGRRDAEMQTVSAVLFCPSRPGRFLTVATQHRLPVERPGRS